MSTLVKSPPEIQLTALRDYLCDLPQMPGWLRSEFLKKLQRNHSDAEFRALRRETLARIIDEAKRNKQIYCIVHFPTERNPCAIDGCTEGVVGAYLELVNPCTMAQLMLPMPLAHTVLAHGAGIAKEPLRNMGNSPYGESTITLDAVAVKAVLQGANVPEPVFEELDAWAIAYPLPRPVVIPYEPIEPTVQEREAGIVPFFNVLARLVELGCADIHIKAGHPPCGVLRGQVTPVNDFPCLTPAMTQYYADILMSEAQRKVFTELRDFDLAFPVRGVGRFRCNIYSAQGSVGMVLRVIASHIQPVENLGLPPVLKKTVFERQGLVLITGQTGSGKTTSLAALLEFANANRRIHVLTLENPIEFVYEPKQAVFTQRELEIDTMSMPNAMRGALRQKPDIILIGEMRDTETITAGLKAAETGHLVVSTLHTNDAIGTINRLINTFPPHEQLAVRIQLANSLKASVAQRLIPRADKPGRVASLEIFLVTPNARGENTKNHILKGNTDALYQILKTSEYDGMQSQNQALFKHYCNGVVSADDALAHSDNPDELVRLMREEAGLVPST